ncbi:unnamed protein product [Symbiodinium natans]|uniref:Uncharacterized protein n=1 Tax=Symbiodinium natans TaxID=878477 RepID=A0A812M9K7_9DINO|nr:unnamed protein product [Symbiodinium natans]
MDQMRAACDQALLSRAAKLFALSEDSVVDTGGPWRAMDCFTALWGGFLYFLIGLAPSGWSRISQKAVLAGAILMTAGTWAIGFYWIWASEGRQQWIHAVGLLERTSFLALLFGVSRSTGFRELLLERLPEAQEILLDSATQYSVARDIWPVSASSVMWLLCLVAETQLRRDEGAVVPPPVQPIFLCAAWAYALLRFNSFLVLLVERFAQSTSRHLEDVELAYEQWACIVAFACQASRWTGLVYIHILTFSFLHMCPVLVALLDNQESSRGWLLPHFFASLTYCGLAACVLQRAAAVSSQRHHAVACTNSYQWALGPTRRWDHHVLVSFMERSDLGIAVCGVHLTTSLLLKSASIFVTAASFVVARLMSLPDVQKSECWVGGWWQQMAAPIEASTARTEGPPARRSAIFCHVLFLWDVPERSGESSSWIAKPCSSQT